MRLESICYVSANFGISIKTAGKSQKRDITNLRNVLHYFNGCRLEWNDKIIGTS